MDILEFAEAVGVELWPVQRVVLKLMYGLALKPVSFPMTFVEVEPGSINTQVTHMTEISYAHMLKQQGRLHVPEGEGPWDLYLVAGRRTGKSRLAALITLYETYRSMGLDFEEEGWHHAVVLTHALIAPTKSQGEAVFSHLLDLEAKMSKDGWRYTTLRKDSVGYTDNPDSRYDKIRASVKTALAKGLRGGAYRSVAFDELSGFSKSSVEEVMLCVEPTVKTFRGLCVVTGTPILDGNTTFHTRYKQAVEDDHTVAIRIPTWEMHPDLADEALTLSSHGTGMMQFLSEFGAEFFEQKMVYVPNGTTAFKGKLEDLVG